MNAARVRKELAAAREAGEALRARSPETVHAELARVFDAWSQPDGALERQLTRRIWETRHVRAVGLRPGLAGWTGDAFLALARRELGDGARLGYPVTAVLLAGEIPMPSLLSMLTPLAVRSPVLVKTGRRDRITAPLVAQSLEHVAPALAPALRVLPPLDEPAMAALLEADCIVATGSDETIESIRARLGPAQGFVPAGHRFSVAALGDEALRPDAIAQWGERAARDVALWDQQGCLSPIAHYVVSQQPDAADRWSEALADGLRKAEAESPRAELSGAEAARLRNERAGAEMRAASHPKVRLLGEPQDRWTIVREADTTMRTAPLNRFVRVHPVADPEGLCSVLRPAGAHLAGVAVAGFGAGQAQLEHSLSELGATRICAPGHLQFPPLDWRREGRDILTPLLAPSA